MQGLNSRLGRFHKTKNNGDKMNAHNRFDADDQLTMYTDRTKRDDVGRVLDHKDQILSKANRGPLARFFGSIRDLMAMIAAYANGRYRAVPWSTIAAAVGCLIYVLSPIDFIPDIVPVFGLVDDAAVLAAALKLVGDGLDDFLDWQSRQT